MSSFVENYKLHNSTVSYKSSTSFLGAFLPFTLYVLLSAINISYMAMSHTLEVSRKRLDCKIFWNSTSSYLDISWKTPWRLQWQVKKMDQSPPPLSISVRQLPYYFWIKTFLGKPYENYSHKWRRQITVHPSLSISAYQTLLLYKLVEFCRIKGLCFIA